MNRITYVVIMSILLPLFWGCGNSQGNILKLVEERDSLKRISELQSTQLQNFGDAINMLNTTLDSIGSQEHMLFVGTGDKPVTKEDVKYNLMRFETLLKHQQDKIGVLEKQLEISRDSNSQTQKLFAHLKNQIRIKNIQIEQLKSELEKKDVDISELKQQVGTQQLKIESQNVKISELSKRAERQGEALARQDAILNNGYVLVGSKDDLKRKGIVNKGKLVSNGILDRTKFFKVDIREWNEVTFQAKRPKILTNMPSSSYELTTTGDGNFTLHVTNPSDFWRISNYLVIQTN